MKNIFLLLILLIAAITSCDQHDCTPETVQTAWTSGKTISREYVEELERNYYRVVDGNNLLFVYNKTNAQCNNVYDDESNEFLAFELDDPELTEFNFIDEDILQINCFYQLSGAWIPLTQYSVKEGSIKGELISENSWKVTVSVKTTPLFENDQPKTIEFSKIYKHQ